MSVTESIGEIGRRVSAERAKKAHDLRSTPSSHPSLLWKPRVPYVARHSEGYIKSNRVTPDYLLRERTTPQLTEAAPAQREKQSPTTLPRRTPAKPPEARPERSGDALSLVIDPALASLRAPSRRPSPERRRHQIAPSEEPRVTQEIRTHDRTATKERSSRRKRAIALAAAASIVAGFLSAGAALHFKDKHQTAKPVYGTTDLAYPGSNPPPETNPPAQIRVTEQGKIASQDGNQWNTAASKTQDALGHPSNAVTNIVAKMEAHDSGNPDPDAATTGDTVTTLTKQAIQEVNRLQQPQGPNASQDEQDAAAIIHKINNLGPMETKQLVDLYGPDLERLKKDLTDILTTQTASEASSTTTAAARETTIFSRTKSTTDALTKGKKAIAALAKRQSSPRLVTV